MIFKAIKIMNLLNFISIIYFCFDKTLATLFSGTCTIHNNLFLMKNQTKWGQKQSFYKFALVKSVKHPVHLQNRNPHSEYATKTTYPNQFISQPPSTKISKRFSISIKWIESCLVKDYAIMQCHYRALHPYLV